MREKKVLAIANTLFFAGYIILPYKWMMRLTRMIGYEHYLLQNIHVTFLGVYRGECVYLLSLYSPIGGIN